MEVNKTTGATEADAELVSVLRNAGITIREAARIGERLLLRSPDISRRGPRAVYRKAMNAVSGRPDIDLMRVHILSNASFQVHVLGDGT